MYKDLYCRMAKGIAPFHNKVLRFNYDLPLQDLIEVLKAVMEKIISDYKPEKIMIFRDIIEYNGSMADRYDETDIIEFKKVLDTTELFTGFYNDIINPCHTEPGMKLGLSSRNYEWYLRIFIEWECNLNPDEPLSGNLELYATDAVIGSISENGIVKANGHLLVHGAKKYLEEIIAE